MTEKNSEDTKYRCHIYRECRENEEEIKKKRCRSSMERQHFVLREGTGAYLLQSS